MEWTVVLAGPARKSLKRIPAGDKTRIVGESSTCLHPLTGEPASL
jgi:hypothetical protein